VAGIELTDEGPSEWIRPVSERPSEELSIEERRYQDGTDVQVLDIVDIEFKNPRPHACQQENHVIDDDYYWERVGRFRAADLLAGAVTNGPLWVDGFSSSNGYNDRIPTDIADRLPSSLILVAPPTVVLSVRQGFRKRQVRIGFSLGTVHYNFTVTDPRVEAEYLRREDGDYPSASRTLVCVSLGEPFEGFRYKLAASVVNVV
jgi:hypothetical protein